MTRRIRVLFVILLCSSIVLLGVVYNLSSHTKKPMPRMGRLTTVSQELIRETTKGNSSLNLNAARQDGVSTIILTGVTGENEAILRKSSDPVEFKIFKDNGEQLMFYDHLLTSTPWKPNSQNLAEFRKTLLNQTNMSCQEDFVLTHRNTRVGDKVPFSVDNAKYVLLNKKRFHTVSKKFLAEEISPVSPLSGKRFKRCSVVGNGGILIGSKCGQEIDQSDYVIRSNFPPIRPHAADAGWKTNLSTMNPSIAERRFDNFKTKKGEDAFVKAVSEYHGILWLPCVAATSRFHVCLKAKHTLNSSGVRDPVSTIGNPSHFLAAMDFWKGRTIKQFLSTGFYMTLLSLTMCEETHLYGFWPFPYRVPDRVTETGTNMMKKVEYHYFDKVGASAVHSMNNEFSVLLQMHVLGLLKLHVRDCDV